MRINEREREMKESCQKHVIRRDCLIHSHAIGSPTHKSSTNSAILSRFSLMYNFHVNYCDNAMAGLLISAFIKY